VVLLGSTFVERDQSHGYLESALVGRFHPRKIVFRNLGWSGDTVFGEARAGFGTTAHGFAHLKQHVLALQPTVIFLSYGANESFAGPEGLDVFVQGLETLLMALDETKARVVFLAPLAHEDLGRPLPDPAEHNKQLKLYTSAIAAVAARRGDTFVNLFDLMGRKLRPAAGAPMTDNGIHLTDYGYWRAAGVIEHALGLAPRRWQIEVDTARGNISAAGTRVSNAEFATNRVRFQALDAQLPLPPAPANSPPQAAEAVPPPMLRVLGLAPGQYKLTVGGESMATASAAAWAAGVALDGGGQLVQAEQLRRAIVAKNRLYFYRWRPQNETYLFGFRKHEQGNNAVEIPQFDPLIEAEEAKIQALAAPVAREYAITRMDAMQ
jgi:hypothetical protein